MLSTSRGKSQTMFIPKTAATFYTPSHREPESINFQVGHASGPKFLSLEMGALYSPA